MNITLMRTEKHRAKYIILIIGGKLYEKNNGAYAVNDSNSSWLWYKHR